jgi:hypothetical protein
MISVAVLFGCLYLLALFEPVSEVENQVAESPSIPPNYYEFARQYVKEHYEVPENRNIEGLVSFLNQIKLRPYEEDAFDCSEGSAMLEWLLEGAGFKASICLKESLFRGHMWCLVALETGDNVAVESTELTDGNYYPPGIVDMEDGRYREYTWEFNYENKLLHELWEEWRENYFRDYGCYPGITFESWKADYVTITPPLKVILPWEPTTYEYYHPPEAFDSLQEVIEAGYENEVDWWNSWPYYKIVPWETHYKPPWTH